MASAGAQPPQAELDDERIETLTPALPGWATIDTNGAVRITSQNAAETQGLRIEGLDSTSLDFRTDGQISARDSISLQGDVDRVRANVSMLWEREVREDSNLELQLLYDTTRDPTAELETYDLNLRHRLATSQRNQLSWGLGLRDASTIGFIRNDLSLAKNKVQVSLGTQIEQDDAAILGIRPNGRLSWKPSGLQTVWAAASQSVSQSTAYEVGYRVQPQPALSVSMASFYSEPGRTTNFETPEDAYGTAVTADFQATKTWKLSASRTAIHSPVTEAVQAPKKLLSLTSSLQLPSKKTLLDATYRRASRVEAIEGTQASTNYDELDVRLAWRPRTALELSLSGRNLLNDQRAQIAPIVAGLAGAPPEGRAAQANVAWSF